MRKFVSIFALVMVALPPLSSEFSAQACSRPVSAPGKSVASSNASQQKASLILRISALETASFPATARVRVLEAIRGPFTAGQIILVQPAPGSVCGPERILKGQKGMIASAYLSKRKGDPVSFSGFLPNMK